MQAKTKAKPKPVTGKAKAKPQAPMGEDYLYHLIIGLRADLEALRDEVAALREDVEFLE